MQIASILIGGVEMSQATLLRGFTITRDLTQRTGSATLIVFARPADLFTTPTPTGSLFGASSFGSAIFGGPTTPPIAIVLPGATVEIWDGAGPVSTGSMFGQSTFGSSLFGGSTRGVLRFAGTVSKISPVAVTVGDNALGYTQYTLECQDYTALLDTAVLPPITLPASSDQDMVRYVIANTLPDINTDHVDSIIPLDALSLNGVTARQALESICALSGGNFWVDENKALQYHSPTSLPAPFAVSDQPDGVSTFGALFAGYQYSEDFTNPGNRIKVIGGGGLAPTVTVDDAASQSQYGRVFTRVFVDATLLTVAAVTARANAELARATQPQKTGQFSTDQQGLDVGQLLSITSLALGISGSFLLRRVTMTWLTATYTRYVVQFGDWNPDLIRFLRQLAALNSATSKPSFNSTVTNYDADDSITVPPGVTTITAECWGPGGNGGNVQGGGGGGGAYARSDITVVPGTTLTITVPAGGSGLPAWFISSSTLAAAAGARGGDFPSSTPGQGGQASASVGSTTMSGQDGATGTPLGADGGAAGNNGGAGGHAGPGVSPGGGGSGGDSGSGGAIGAPGRVRLTYSVG